MNELKNSKCLVIGGGGFIGSFVEYAKIFINDLFAFHHGKCKYINIKYEKFISK
jgi:hypothetical protein